MKGTSRFTNAVSKKPTRETEGDAKLPDKTNPYSGLSDSEIQYQFSLDRGNFINQSFFGEESSFRVLEAEKAFNNQLDY